MGLIPKVIIGILVLGVIGSVVGGNEESTSSNTEVVAETTPEITYTPVSVSEMVETLESNAMKASETYKGQYLEITGKLNVIDSNGKYISLVGDGDFEIIGVQCYLKTDEQKESVMNMSIGDTVTLKGKCKDVGEVLGYSLDIDSIN